MIAEPQRSISGLGLTWSRSITMSSHGHNIFGNSRKSVPYIYKTIGVRSLNKPFILPGFSEFTHIGETKQPQGCKPRTFIWHQ
ncbi:hypothetical protein ONE63_001152 [Megalurothrips usitatus]|uniref:Uncharacterized protein n=1 Tax=Megalurothrips usitatus TaxID=439358 RepID=A0AAV7XFV0_9NEOP|nr:hypothetical protein ONE63_001152 [Megalurothrips usitatus]